MAFLTDKAAKERIAALETQVSELEANAATQDAEISRLQGELATANESILTANQERDQARADLEAANATIAERDATIAAHPTEAQISERIETAALAKFQSLGGNPAPASSEQADNPIKSLTGLEKTTAAFKAQSSSKK